MKIETTLIINANINEVWKKLTDFEKYAEWNQFITRIEGKQQTGSTLTVDITPPKSKKMTFMAVLKKYVENEEMRWVGVMGASWLFRGEHYFKLEPISDQSTRLIHGEIFTGWLIPLFRCLAAKNTEAGFHLMNANLDKLLEAEKFA